VEPFAIAYACMAPASSWMLLMLMLLIRLLKFLTFKVKLLLFTSFTLFTCLLMNWYPAWFVCIPIGIWALIFGPDFDSLYGICWTPPEDWLLIWW
jgi:hypothetical protein